MSKERFEIVVSEKLAATRCLSGFEGKLAVKHHHVYRLDYHLSAGDLNEYGITCNFDEAKAVLADSIADLQGAYLNEVEDVIAMSASKHVNPTGEVVARVVWNRAEKALAEKGLGVKVEMIIVAESPSGKVFYRKED